MGLHARCSFALPASLDWTG